MKSKLETTPPTSPRRSEEQRLVREAAGFFAPSKNKAIFESRAEQHVREGLEKFDAQQVVSPDTFVMK